MAARELKATASRGFFVFRSPQQVGARGILFVFASVVENSEVRAVGPTFINRSIHRKFDTKPPPRGDKPATYDTRELR